MKDRDAKSLITKYQAENANSEEYDFVADYVLLEDEIEVSEKKINQIHSSIHRAIPVLTFWPKLVAAVAAMITVAVTIYFFDFPIEIENTSAALDKIYPAKYAPTLRLPNGKIIELQCSKNGITVNASNLAYNDGTTINGNKETITNSVELALSTLTTPKGGQYQIILPDGSKVWLNAASSLKFPTKFTGLSIRRVVLAGEAYFEVSKDQKHPFVVETRKQTVTVLGTHFNINSYADEPATKTTLLEGSVLVNAISANNANESLNNNNNAARLNYPLKDSKSSLPGGESSGAILKPGQQSTFTTAGNIKVKNVDAAEFISWKDGYFQFDENDDIRSVMRQISKWYDVDVVFEGELSKAKFSGQFHKNISLAKTIELLQAPDIQFRLNGRKLIVSNRQ
ncbi:putative anti-sigma factor [Pedobacter sp. BAL39]|uniref:FecR family protein n=1 Tax=Pedobacter sp. BAL39 TaxID=391596 RepID=UPI0001559344|nr:FecR family protein [Pedobacter sp. BAL39]EDM35376.1 putative anti-sigma factor [Pedobacter sp. BAL39]